MSRAPEQFAGLPNHWLVLGHKAWRTPVRLEFACVDAAFRCHELLRLRGWTAETRRVRA